MLHLGVMMSMEHLESGVIFYTKRMEISYDFDQEQDERIKSLRTLDNFHQRAAAEMKKELDQFLATQQAGAAEE